MLCNKSISIPLLMFILFNPQFNYCQSNVNPELQSDTSKNSVEFSPLSPFINIYAIYYNYKFTQNDEGMIGPVYMSIPYKDIGRTHASGLIIGYRRYLIKGFSFEYQLMPAYDNFYEENEEKYYNSFDLWNEFRISYKIDFSISDLPCYVNIQWPFGFSLYSGNKPKSFKDHEKQGDNRFFYKALLLFVGISF